MTLVRFDNTPTTTDTVLLEIRTTDESGVAADPYKLNNVIVYFLDRGIASSPSLYEFTEVSSDGEIDVSFSNAVPVKVYGTDGEPAWLSTDTSRATVRHIALDANDDPQFGVFQTEWNPEFNREGEYFVCWTWTATIGGSTASAFNRFFLNADSRATAVLPQHATVPGKYEMLMERYLPSMFKEHIAAGDVTPDVLSRFNNSVAASFTDTENKANQILGLQDANSLHEALLPYLSNLFNWKLKTGDPNLWRRQIKRAVPLYKQKGTYKALKEALAESGINLNKITKYWQVASKSTWQEVFRVGFDNEDSFTLEKVPLAYDSLNFELKLMPATSNAYTTLDNTYVSFTTADGVAYMDWIGAYELNKDDILKVVYKVAPVLSQPVEDYIRSLSLADNRSEAVMRDNDICYPKKNWNVRLIADDDDMLPIVCPTRHPFHVPVVFGKVRTEFPYSENIYNMDEYNGCGIGSTLVTTSKGICRLDELKGNEELVTEYGLRKFEKLVCHGERPTVVIKTKMGRQLNVTPNHRFRTLDSNGRLEWVRADAIQPGTKLLGVKNRTVEEQQTIGLTSRLKQSHLCVLPDNCVSAVLSKAATHGVACEARTILEQYVTNGWFFDTVKSVNPGEDELVYDPLNVEGTNSYLTNDLVSHNSNRDSTEPCDIDRYFVDSCPCCQSSKISVDVELNNLSNDRMVECQDILREFLPFHAVVHSVNFDGAFEEFMLPPVEEIQTYIINEYTDSVINGQMVLNRTIQPWTQNMKREMLATANNLLTNTSGKGHNIAYSLYYPAESFDHYTMGLDMTNNQLEILSGLNAGVYSVTNPDGHLMDFDDPTMVPSPMNKTQFPFRLSNNVYEGSGNIFQDNLTTFTDSGVNFSKYNMKFSKDAVTPWRVVVTAGPNAGSYPVYNLLPDGSLVLTGWPGAATVGSLAYRLDDDTGDEQDAGTTGKLTVRKRGRFETADNLVQEYLIEPNFYLSCLGTQYKISSFLDDTKCYLDGYNSGTVVGTSTVKIFKRVINNGIGYVRARGMKLATVNNYYADLQVSDQFEDNQHVDNFVVLIGTDYYQIGSWSDTSNGEGRYEIVLNGLPLIEWGTGGTTGVTFSIIQFLKTSPVTVTKTFPTVVSTTLDRVDRRGNEVILSTSDTSGGMTAAMAATLLNAANNGQPMELVTQGENISIQIEYLE